MNHEPTDKKLSHIQATGARGAQKYVITMYVLKTYNTNILTRSPSSGLSHPFFGEGSPTDTDYRRKKTSNGYQLILTSLLEDLVSVPFLEH